MEMENPSSQYQTSPPIVSHQRRPQGKVGKPFVFMHVCCAAIREARKSRAYWQESNSGENREMENHLCLCSGKTCKKSQITNYSQITFLRGVLRCNL